jgi:virulence factor Mce-like protein
MPTNERALRLRLGAFVLVSLILLGSLIVLFGSRPNLFRRTVTYVVRFPDTPGLTPGAPVRRAGVRIGEVKGVELDEERDDVRVVLAIDARYTLRKNERPTLNTSVLGGDSTIDFVLIPPEPGKPPPDRAAIPPGSEIQGERQVTVNALLRGAGELVPTTQETLNEIRKSLQEFEKRVDRLAPKAEAALDEFQKLTKSTNERLVPRTEATLDELRRLSKSANDTMPDFQRLVRGSADAVPELRKTNEQVQSLTKEIRDAVPEARAAIKAFDRNVNDIGDAARQARRLTERVDVWVQSNQEKVTRLIESANDTVNRLGTLLSDENQRSVRDTLRNTQKASERFESIARNADETIKELRPAAQQLRETLKDASEFMKDLRGTTAPLRERGPSIMRNLDESLDKTNRILGDLRLLVEAVGRSDGTLSKLLNDPSLYNNLDAAACQVARMMPQLDQILKDFGTFADKLARHPEALGLGGAIRPGSGVKEAQPTPPFGPRQHP